MLLFLCFTTKINKKKVEVFYIEQIKKMDATEKQLPQAFGKSGFVYN